MTAPEPDPDDDHTEPIQAPPTANPRRVQVPDEGLDGPIDKGLPEITGTPPTEEG
ncbi:hypothetical protein [Micromonospora endophytica]|uniref:hypothetical protein n=1 Tax=Micromonospora endophytica TaxID=515350 RepID=UPI0015E8C235|nr:hypothetical protein [Micromonospora endophytica]BCJ62940.1 hypothetical protein Jiend_63620 [Micromonospora endophytica]